MTEPQVIGEITLEPNWEVLCLWFARALADHSFDRGAHEPVVSFIEITRYLTHSEADAIQRVVDRLR